MTEHAGESNVPLDPHGPPVAPRGINLNDLTPVLVAGAGIATAALGLGVILAGGSAGRTCGATRSSQLKWEQRTVAIEQAVAEQDAERAARQGDDG